MHRFSVSISKSPLISYYLANLKRVDEKERRRVPPPHQSLFPPKKKVISCGTARRPLARYGGLAEKPLDVADLG